MHPCASLPASAQADRDFAVGGEFNGIGAEIQQYLAQSAGIPDHVVGQQRIDIRNQFELLGMRLYRKQVRNVIDNGAQIQIDLLQIDLARFDLGEIQDVVDDGQEAAGAGADGFGVIALSSIQTRIEQQFGHADHAVHRRANFVAHVGEELGFRHHREFRAVFRLLKIGVRALQVLGPVRDLLRQRRGQPSQVADAQPVQRRGHGEEAQEGQQPKPPRLKEGRFQPEAKLGAAGARDPVIVRGRDLKGIVRRAADACSRRFCGCRRRSNLCRIRRGDI